MVDLLHREERAKLGELRIIGRSSTAAFGERIEERLKLTWREGNREEIARAEEVFKKYVGRGWLAIGETSDRKKQIFAFDPTFDRITLSPIMVGG